MKHASNVVAIFDLDGTLTTRDTLLPVLVHYGWAHGKYRALLGLPVILICYALRILPARSAKEKLLKLFFQHESVAAVQSTIEQFVNVWLPAHIHPVGCERLRYHQDAGHQLLLVSASPDLYVPLVAKQLGIHNALCTTVAQHDGVIDGGIVGNNLTGQAKVAAIQQHVDRHAVATVGYGNSRGDWPLLRWCDKGFLVTKRGLRVANGMF